MLHRHVLARAAMVSIAVAGFAAALAGHAQRPVRTAPWTPPRTPWGEPDLQGIWTYATMTPLERPRDLAGKRVLNDEETAAYERETDARQRATNNTAGPDWWDPGTRRLVDGRTSLIVDPEDGRLPAMTDDARQRAAARAEARPRGGLPDGPEDLGLNVRCLQWATAGPPLLPGVYNNNVQFVQTRDYIAIVSEMIHDARIVRMNQPHLPPTVRKWLGDSVGHWEGDTLVVDTTNFTEKTRFRGATENLHVVERFTRVDADTLRYKFTIEDPKTWETPWTGEYTWPATKDHLYEYACHEANYAMGNILRGARQRESDDAKTKSKQ